MSESPAGARVRAAAATAVDGVVSAGRSLDAALAAAETGLDAADRALLRMLAFGTLRRYWELDSWIDTLAARPPRGKDGIVRALLAVGLLQLTETRIPDHAAVSPTVEAARLLGRQKATGFVNAVLRRFLRERASLHPARSLRSEFNHPDWMISALQADWPGDWREILAANDERAPMWLRVNRRQVSVDDYCTELHAAGIEAAVEPGWPDALRLADPVPVATLPGFADGRVSVQDAAAQLAAPWLLGSDPGDPEPSPARPATGDRARNVLDACAAPGGKSAHLKEIGGDTVALTALEKDPARAGELRSTLQRLDLDATIVTGDASLPGTWHRPPLYDAILVDAPCSATGVIRRHPDIKHLRRAGDVPTLAALQRNILDALWPLLAPGGRLLYVTCSVLHAENDAVAGAFLEATADARENPMLQNNNIRAVMRRKAYGYQLLPGTAGMDGFYFACLEKVA